MWKNKLDAFTERCEDLAVEDRRKVGHCWKPETTFVYFITDGWYIKIGVANNVEKRLLQLQTGNAHNLLVLLRVPFTDSYAAYRAEKEFHREYSEKRLVGEWFDIANDPLFILYFFRQKEEYMTDEALRFVLGRAVRINYRDPDFGMNDRINDLKYEYLDWYDPEGRAERERRGREGAERLNRFLNKRFAMRASANA